MGCVGKHPKQRLNVETYYFYLHFKGQAAFVPTLSCHHVIMEVCLSPAPDMDPTVLVQRACKTVIFLERDEKARGCPGTGSTSKGETQQKEVVKTYEMHRKEERTCNKTSLLP